MNVRLQYDIEFPAGIYMQDQLKFNSYSVTLHLLTNTSDPISINVALERIKWFVYAELEDAVFVNQQQKERAELMSMMGINVTLLPEEPVDQVVGMMLFYKLNAITEGRLLITDLAISSAANDGITYMHNEEDHPGPYAIDGWWSNPGCQHETYDDSSVEKIVKVSTRGWHEAGLDWPDEQQPVANTVVYANFTRNED